MIFKAAYREIKNNYRISLAFVVNLTIGLTGFVCLDAFETSLNRALQRSSKDFLSADLSLSARRKLQDQEVESVKRQLPPGTKMDRLIEFFSMVAGPDHSRLVQVKGIGPDYPYYGQMLLDSGRVVTSATAKEIATEPVIWVYPELLVQLNLKVGDSITLGKKSFRIADVVRDDSTQTFRIASLAPRIYVGYSQVPETGLVTFGSTMSEAALFQVPGEIDIERTGEIISRGIQDPGVQITTPQKASEDTGRVLSYLNDYLALVSLVALFLAGLGTAFLYRSFLASRLTNIAIFNALGMSKARAQMVDLLQLMAWGMVGGLLSLGLSSVLLRLLGGLLAEFTPLNLVPQIPLSTAVLALLIGALGCLLVGLPFVLAIRNISVSQLLHEESSFEIEFGWLEYLGFLPALVVYWLMAVTQSHSLKIGSLFIALVAASLFAIGGLGWLLVRYLPSRTSFWPLRHAILNLQRKPFSFVASLLALGLGTLLMNLIPVLKVNIQDELDAPRAMRLPSLFMFDIQDDQLEAFNRFIAERKLSLENVSALVRARIVDVNGKSFDKNVESESIFKSKEREEEARFRNRGFNLSFRPSLSSAETLTRGSFPATSYDPASGALPEISVEERFAERMHFKMNDVLKFDVQGVEIQGKVTSFRQVKWNSFQPNFFVLFQAGVLEEAPKTYIASMPQVEDSVRDEVQLAMAKMFPNVSTIDVHRVVKRIFDITERMSWSLQLMAAVSLLAGFTVLLTLVRHQALTRRWDLNMFKILGAGQRPLNAYFLLEFGLLGLLASLLGVALSGAVGFVLAQQLFEGSFRWAWRWPLISLAGVPLVCLLIAYLGSFAVVRERPSAIIQEGRL